MWFLIVTAIVLFYMWLKNFYSYFDKKGFPNVPAKIPMGSAGDVQITEHTTDFLIRNFTKFKNDAPAFGFFFLNRRTIVPTDPELVKEILVRNFESFHEKGFPVNKEIDPLANNIFMTSGQHWKETRTKLTPTFTSGKMKMMFPIVASKADRMIEFLESKVKVENLMEFKDIFASYTIESIASVAFGIEVKSHGDPENDFKKASRYVMEPEGWEMAKQFLLFAFEGVAKFLKIPFTPQKATEFFMKVVGETFEYRVTNKTERNDFFQLLMNIMKDDKEFTFDELAANCFIFFFGGFETSSGASTFISYELALNQEIQEKLRDEINEVLERHNGEVTYDAIMEMKYLNMVFNESMRRWPISDALFRQCAKDFKIPNTDLVIEKGTFIMVPTVGLHNDERFWDEPEKFDPERFNEENKKKIVPYSYIPFGEGPRVCIGQRFGVMQTKLGIVKLLKSFKLSPCDKTLIPMKLQPNSGFQSALGGMWLKLDKIA